MKLAILKGGTNITFSSNNASAANADILYFLRTLLYDKKSDITVDIITHKTRNTVLPKSIGFKEIQDVHDYNEYDAVILFNYSINFFGGIADPNLIQMYKALSNTTKPIIYANTDGQLSFKDLWPSIMKRDWAKNLSPDMFEIDPLNVYYLSQGRNFSKLLKQISGKHDHIKVPMENLRFFPFYATILTKWEKHFKPNTLSFDERIYDLGFGGASRNTHKKKRIKHYYDDPSFKNMVFGNLRNVGLKNTLIGSKVSYQLFVKEMMKCKATVIVGDQYYEDHFFTLRMFEALLADNIMYIDERMDKDHKFFLGDKAFDSFYINSTKDIPKDMYEDYHMMQVAKTMLYDKYKSYKLNKELIDTIGGIVNE